MHKKNIHEQPHQHNTYRHGFECGSLNPWATSTMVGFYINIHVVILSDMYTIVITYISCYATHTCLFTLQCKPIYGKTSQKT